MHDDHQQQLAEHLRQLDANDMVQFSVTKRTVVISAVVFALTLAIALLL